MPVYHCSVVYCIRQADSQQLRCSVQHSVKLVPVAAFIALFRWLYLLLCSALCMTALLCSALSQAYKPLKSLVFTFGSVSF